MKRLLVILALVAGFSAFGNLIWDPQPAAYAGIIWDDASQ